VREVGKSALETGWNPYVPVGLGRSTHPRHRSGSRLQGADAKPHGKGRDAQRCSRARAHDLGEEPTSGVDAGLLEQVTTPANDVVQTKVDEIARMPSVTPPGRVAHRFDFTPGDRLQRYRAPEVAVTPPDLAVARDTDYAYDLGGVLSKVTQPGGGALEFFRELTGTKPDVPRGFLGRVVDTRGVTSQYAYWPTGQLKSITPSQGPSLTFGYTGGLLTRVDWGTPVTGTLERTFDNQLRVATRKVTFGATSSEIAFRYDADGFLTAAGEPATVDTSPLLQLVYDHSGTNNGRLTSVCVKSVVDSRTYNEFGEVKTYAVSRRQPVARSLRGRYARRQRDRPLAGLGVDLPPGDYTGAGCIGAQTAAAVLIA
jgi:hypothetical protein